LPIIFNSSPLVGLPISVGRSSYDHIFVESSRGVQSYESAQNEKYFDDMSALQKYILENSGYDLLSINNEIWKREKKASMQSELWFISRLPTVNRNKEVYILGGRGPVWIIVAIDNKVTDFQLVSAIQNEYDAQGEYIGRIASLDTTFGDGAVFQDLPITNFEKTGIFCSSITYGQTHSIHFKRRITPEGKIENKEIEGGYKECKAPW
jgi:hypothetical protein